MVKLSSDASRLHQAGSGPLWTKKTSYVVAVVVVLCLMGAVHQISYFKQMSLQKHATTTIMGSNQRSPVTTTTTTTTVGKDPSPPQLVFLGENTTEVIEGTTTVEDVPRRKVDNENDDYHVAENDDWSDLSPEAKEAALALGYTKTMWDKHGKNDLIDDKDWKELSPEQTAALRVMGYSAFNW
eukprot:scaffold76166_cov54-Attheya_sp.AAC.1